MHLVALETIAHHGHIPPEPKGGISRIALSIPLAPPQSSGATFVERDEAVPVFDDFVPPGPTLTVLLLPLDLVPISGFSVDLLPKKLNLDPEDWVPEDWVPEDLVPTWEEADMYR